VRGLLSSDLRAPWWKWALLSVSTIVCVTVVTLAGMIALIYAGVDITDYIYLSRPPHIVEGHVAALVGLIIVGGTITPVLIMVAFRPARLLTWGQLSRPEDPGGLVGRVLLGLAGALALQIGWSSVGPQVAEEWQVVKHLVYAMVGGGAIAPMVWLAVAVGVVGPFAEELLYRGLIFGLFRTRMGFMAAALLSATIFGISHGLHNALPTAVLGFFFAYQVERDKTLLGAIALHVIHNLGALVAMTAGL